MFIDDDFVMGIRYLAECVALFDAHPGVAMMTGEVIADGISGPGLNFDEADRLIAADVPPGAAWLEDVYNGYGCNMAIRMAPVREAGLRSEEHTSELQSLMRISYAVFCLK